MRALPSLVPERFAEEMAAIEREPLPRNLAAVLDAAAARYRERPLWVPIEDQGSALTFGEFARWTARCVTYLASIGVGSGSRVAVMLPNVPAFAITWMALARLGAILVPLNTRYTAHEMAQVLESARAEHLLVDSGHLETVDELAAERLPVPRDEVIVHGGLRPPYRHDWLAGVAGSTPSPSPAAEVDPDQLLSIMFTSGSTGLPKGCMLTHRYWLTIGRVRAAHGVPVDRFLVDMPVHYMGGQWRFLMALQTGAAMFVARQPSLSRFVDRLWANQLQFCVVGNAVAKLPEEARYRDLCLRWVGSVGLNKELHEPLQQRLRAPVREIYGTTETGATAHMPVAAEHMVGSGSCGLPVAFRECMIADGQGGEAVRGRPGELWVAGPGILEGYYGRPEVDAEVRRGRWFRTGDLARQDREGYLYIVGRIKDVIRRGGENVSAAEVEAVLTTMPEVLEAAAVPVPDPVRGEEVKVYLALCPPLTAAEVPPARVMAHCRRQLARFKLPRYLEYVDRLPRTASDKIAKAEMVSRSGDPRRGSYDFAEELWR